MKWYANSSTRLFLGCKLFLVAFNRFNAIFVSQFAHTLYHKLCPIKIVTKRFDRNKIQCVFHQTSTSIINIKFRNVTLYTIGTNIFLEKRHYVS